MFVLAFSLGSALLALWIFVCLPKLGPARLTWAFAHVGGALVVGLLLKPGLAAIAGSGAPLAVFVAVFAVALPALTYMFVAGAWLLRVAGAGLTR